jgi:hypothetical protein
MKSTFEDELEKHGRFVYANKGTSMMPLLRQGRDLMIIEKKGPQRCRKYDAVLYRRGNKYILHRILKVRDADYVICGDHQWQREYGITDAQILGIMTAFVRNGKEIPVTDWKYQCYVHLWCDLYYIRAGVLIGCAVGRKISRKIIYR